MTPRENYNRSHEEGAQGAVVDGDWGDRDATVRTKAMGRGKGGAGASMASTSTATMIAGAGTTTAIDGAGLNRNGNGNGKGKGKGESGDAESGADIERGENVGGGGEGSSDPLSDGSGGNGKSGGSGGVDETMTREVAFSRPPATPQQHQRTNGGIPSSVTPRDESREYELESLGEHSREASSYVWRVLVPPHTLFTIHIPVLSFLMRITRNPASANVVN